MSNFFNMTIREFLENGFPPIPSLKDYLLNLSVAQFITLAALITVFVMYLVTMFLLTKEF